MPHSMKLIFIQLPRLDPDVASPGENNMAAAACLRAALARSDEASHWIVCETLDVQDAASDARLLERRLFGRGVFVALAAAEEHEQVRPVGRST